MGLADLMSFFFPFFFTIRHNFPVCVFISEEVCTSQSGHSGGGRLFLTVIGSQKYKPSVYIKSPSPGGTHSGGDMYGGVTVFAFASCSPSPWPLGGRCGSVGDTAASIRTIRKNVTRATGEGAQHTYL